MTQIRVYDPLRDPTVYVPHFPGSHKGWLRGRAVKRRPADPDQKLSSFRSGEGPVGVRVGGAQALRMPFMTVSIAPNEVVIPGASANTGALIRPRYPVEVAMPANPSCRHEFVSTAGLLPADRFKFWRHTLVKRYEPLGPAGMVGESFTANVRKLIAPEGEFTDLSMTPVGITRTQQLLRADGVDNIVLTLTLSGGGEGWFGDPDRETRLGGPRIRVRHQGRPYAFRWTGADNRTLHVELPSAAFEPRTLGRILSTAGTLLKPRGLAPMLAGQMRALAEAAPHLDPVARAAGLRSVVDLAATVLRLEFGAEAAESEVCEDGMLIAAQALIVRHFASTDVSPDEIARRLGCSRAHLYRVFSRHGLTVAGYLREIRLQRSRAALAAAGPRDKVGDIAFRCGFGDLVNFTRLFRQRFGLTPGALKGGEGLH
jgi:AraC-like DNA-binding protein